MYSSDALHQLALTTIGPSMEPMFQDTFTSYIGPPSTALLMLPFTFVPFSVAIIIYRVAILIAFALSVYITGLALEPSNRPRAWFVGAFTVLLFQPVVLSVQLGQVDAWIVLTLSISIWATSRARWWLAGSAVGFAALLKVTPGLIAFYLLLRGKWQAAGGAVVLSLGLLGISVLIVGPSELMRFLQDVAPTLSAGSMHTQNQSFPAWIARIFVPDNNLLQFSRSTGFFNILGLPLAGFGSLVLAIRYRNNQFVLLEYASIILLALLAGPITWDHYATWAILPAMLMVGSGQWATLAGRHQFFCNLFMVLGVFFFMLPTPFFDETAIAEHWILRIDTGQKTLAFILWLGVSIYLQERNRKIATNDV
jgi:alpha-1,2-mannosyltransferase